MAAIMPTEEPYMKTSVFVQWKKRIPWLLVLMISASFTQAVINTYQDAIIAAGYACYDLIYTNAYGYWW